jgi:heme exporter protein B
VTAHLREPCCVPSNLKLFWYLQFFLQSFTITAKDLRAEFRSKETINATLSFSLVILLLFSFAFDPTFEQIQELVGGLLWLVFAFASALVINRSFARDLPNDCLDALLASPISGAALFFGKAIANFVLLLTLEFICLPVFGIFYNVTWTKDLPTLLLVFLLTTWGLSIVGTTFSAMTVNLRLRELMLPMLVYPILIPCLLASMQLTALLIAGKPITGDLHWLRLLVGFDVIYTALALTLVDNVLLG